MVGCDALCECSVLVDAKADVDKGDNTALMRASKEGHEAVVRCADGLRGTHGSLAVRGLVVGGSLGSGAWVGVYTGTM